MIYDEFAVVKMNNLTQNIDNVCRVCLRQDIRKLKNVFDNNRAVPIYLQITMIANVMISKDDGLPHNICMPCLKNLNAAIEFKNLCESSNVTLIATLQDLKVVVKKEEPEPEPSQDMEYLEDLFDYLETDIDNDEPKAEPEFVETKKKSLDMVALGLKPSRAIDLRLECHDCGGFFKSKCKLRVHWKKVHLPESLKCPVCKRKFSSFKAFNIHKMTKLESCLYLSNAEIESIGKKRIFHCKQCPYTTKRAKDFRSHFVKHTGERPYVCDTCGSSHTQQSSLQAHKESAHKAYLSEMTCPFCGKYIKGRNRMYRHLKCHRQKEVPCTICKKIFKSRDSMKQHLARHSGVKSCACEQCGKAFYTLSELGNHRRMVHRKDDIWFKCDKCGYKSHRNEAVKKHKRRHTDSNFSCTVCGMFFESQEDLFSHQKKHFGERKYPCHYCEKRFLSRDGAFKHVRNIHFKNTPYVPHSYALPETKRGRKRNCDKFPKPETPGKDESNSIENKEEQEDNVEITASSSKKL